MRLSTKQKVYASVLGLGVTALIVDRVVLLPRESAAQSAEPVEPAVALSTPVVEAARELVSASVLSASTVTIADELDRVAATRGFDLVRIPDAFQPSSSWLTGQMETEAPAPDRSAAERFKQEHTLTAVMATGSKGYAIVDGKFLLIGQEMDGFTLVAVGNRSAVLESAEARVELTLSEPAVP